jgi:hypothetical protein
LFKAPSGVWGLQNNMPYLCLMKRLIFLLLVFSFSLSFAQEKAYTVKFRVQFKDSAVYCACPQDDNTTENGSTGTCNPLGEVMINIYSDSNLVHTDYTDYTGYTTTLSFPGHKYRIIFHKEHYDSASVQVDFRKSNIIAPGDGPEVHFKSDGNNYFICIVLNPQKKKSGVRIVPIKN